MSAATVSFQVPSPLGPRPVTVSYTREGTGEPLLLLHGIGHHRQAWDPVTHILAAEREVITVDLPGFGESPALPDGLSYDLPTTTAVFGAFCEALELDRPHVAGNSLGGLLALELGREKLVRSVTALSPAGFWNEAERRYAFGILLTMRHISRRMPLPLVERLSRSAAWPHRPHEHHLRPSEPPFTRGGGRRDARTGRGHRVRRDPPGGRQRPVHRRHPRPSDHRGLGHTGLAARTPTGPPRQAGHPRRPPGAAARLRPLPHERRPRPRRARHPRREPLTCGGSTPPTPGPLRPGLRLGWLLVPASLAEEVVERKRTVDLGHPVIDQALFARFVERGDYDRQLRRCQRAYRERRDALVSALAEHFPGAEVSGIAAGLHVIVSLPDRYGPLDRFLQRAATAGVAVRGLAQYGRVPDEGVRLVLGYAHLSPVRIREGVGVLASAVG